MIGYFDLKNNVLFSKHTAAGVHLDAINLLVNSENSHIKLLENGKSLTRYVILSKENKDGLFECVCIKPNRHAEFFVNSLELRGWEVIKEALSKPVYELTSDYKNELIDESLEILDKLNIEPVVKDEIRRKIETSRTYINE